MDRGAWLQSRGLQSRTWLSDYTFFSFYGYLNFIINANSSWVSFLLCSATAVNLYTLLSLQFLIFIAFSSFYRWKSRKRLSLKPFPHSQKKKKKCTQPELLPSSVWFQELSYLFYEPGDDPLLFHLLVLMNKTKSLWIFCGCALCPYHIVCLGRHYHFHHQIPSSSPFLLLSPSLPSLPPSLAPAVDENKCHPIDWGIPVCPVCSEKEEAKGSPLPLPRPPDIWRLTGHLGLASPVLLQSGLNHSGVLWDHEKMR